MDAAEVLMNPGFGAFGGLTVNQNTALKGLDAQKTMGEIAMQPAEMRQKAAHARLYESQAAVHEEEVASQKRMGELMRGMAPGASSVATPGPGDMGNKLLQLSSLAFDAGMVKQATELATKGTTVLQHVAAAAASEASVGLRQARASAALLDQVGGLVYSVSDQASYDQAKMALIGDPQIAALMKQRGIDPSRLPSDVGQAMPILEGLKVQVQKAKDIVAAKEKKLVDAAEIAKDNAQAGAASAAAGASSARERLTKAQLNDIEKNGGDTTAGARALRDAKRKATEEAATDRKIAQDLKDRQQAAKEAKMFDPVPQEAIANPAKRVVGKTYNTPKGALTWTGSAWVKPGGTVAPTIKPASALTADELDDEE